MARAKSCRQAHILCILSPFSKIHYFKSVSVNYLASTNCAILFINLKGLFHALNANSFHDLE